MPINTNQKRRPLIAVGGNLAAQFFFVFTIFLIPWISPNEQELIFTLNYYFGTIVYAIASGYLSIYPHNKTEIIFTSAVNLIALLMVLQLFTQLSNAHFMFILTTCSSMAYLEFLYSRAVYENTLIAEIGLKLSVPIIKFSAIYTFFIKFPSLTVNDFYASFMLVTIIVSILLFIKHYSFKILTFQINYILYLFYSLLPIFYTNANSEYSRMALYMTFVNFILLPFTLYMHRLTIPNLITNNNKHNHSNKWHYALAVLPLLMLNKNFYNHFGLTELNTVFLLVLVIVIRVSNTYYSLLIQTPKKKII